MANEAIQVVYDGDKTLNVLSRLIQKRKRLLGESTQDAVVATVITVLKSLRADTREAPKTARPESYKITDTGWVGGWERHGGSYHRVPRTSADRRAPKVPGVFPVNLAGQHYEPGEFVHVYKIEPVNDKTMQWNKTKHHGYWYVFAKSEGIAQKFAKEHMSKRIQSYRGLAKTALGFAMAAVSTHGEFAGSVRSAKAKSAAKQAAQVMKAQGVDSYSVTVNDMLRYSKTALKSGPAGLDRAMMKAANSIAGRLSKMATAKLDMDLQTPFPEVKG